MPYTVAISFDKFRENIELSGDHRETATARKDRIVSLLKNSFEILDAFPTGSIPRFTAVRGHADLDVMVALHYGKHIKGKNPSGVLQEVQDALGEYRTNVRKNGQAVTLSYKTWPDVDIVPVSRTVNEAGNVTHYEVPDSNSETWIVSKPRTHSKVMSQKNEECGPDFKRIVKMIKWWNHQHLFALPHAIAFLRYIRNLVKARRANPQGDLVTAPVRAEEAGDQLSEDELVAMIFLLLVAGHETTVNLIGNGMLALLQNPDQMGRLRDNPVLIKVAVEELLRYNGPLETATERYAREDTTVAGVTIPRGEMVHAVLASANRDERQFEQPERLDLGREPNPHVAFGLGIHYCLGASLARLEGQIAIATLPRRHQPSHKRVRPTYVMPKPALRFILSKSRPTGRIILASRHHVRPAPSCFFQQ